MLESFYFIPSLMITLLLVLIFFKISSAISFAFLGLFFGFIFLNVDVFFPIPAQVYKNLQQQQWLSVLLIFFINFFFKEYNKKIYHEKREKKIKFKNFALVTSGFYGSESINKKNFIFKKNEKNSVVSTEYFLNYNLLSKVTLPNIFIILLAININLKAEELLYYTIGPAILCCFILFPINAFRSYIKIKKNTSSVKNQKIIFYDYLKTIFSLIINILITFLLIINFKLNAIQVEHFFAICIIFLSIFSFFYIPYGENIVTKSFWNTARFGGLLLISLLSIQLFVAVFEALNGQNLLLKLFDFMPEQIEIKIIIFILILFFLQFIFSKIDICIFVIPLLLYSFPIESSFKYSFLVLILFVFIKDSSDQYFQNSINISKFSLKKNKNNIVCIFLINFLVFTVIVLFPDYIFFG